jgi:hypothetical protein
LNLPSGSESMADAYALNVADNAVWVYYYSQFPVVRIDRDGRTRGWNTGTRGAKALAVDSRRILLFGGYGTDRDRVVLAEFGQTQLENTADYRLVFPSGDPVDDIAAVVGRGPILHVFSQSAWYQLVLFSSPESSPARKLALLAGGTRRAAALQVSV